MQANGRVIRAIMLDVRLSSAVVQQQGRPRWMIFTSVHHSHNRMDITDDMRTHVQLEALGFRVEALGVRVYGLGLRVYGAARGVRV